jgi:hypothetical protein
LTLRTILEAQISKRPKDIGLQLNEISETDAQGEYGKDDGGKRELLGLG